MLYAYSESDTHAPLPVQTPLSPFVQSLYKEHGNLNPFALARLNHIEISYTDMMHVPSKRMFGNAVILLHLSIRKQPRRFFILAQELYPCLTNLKPRGPYQETYDDLSEETKLASNQFAYEILYHHFITVKGFAPSFEQMQEIYGLSEADLCFDQLN